MNISAVPGFRLIFVAGHIKSGKDRFADYIVEELGVRGVKIGMSDAIINMASYLFPVNEPYAWQDQDLRVVPRTELGGKNTREILRSLGDAVRSVDAFAWVNAMLRSVQSIQRARPEGCTIVVTGIRMIKEAVVARAVGGQLVGITSSRFVVDSPNTPTEREVMYVIDNLCHSVVDNNGTLDQLKISALRELAYTPVYDGFNPVTEYNREAVEGVVSRHENLFTSGES